MIRFGVILFIICFVASLTLAVVYKFTAPIIAQQKTDEVQQSLKLVLPKADSFKQKTYESKEYYEGCYIDKVIGYALPVVAKGYGGDIRMLAGVTKDGTITGIVVLEHQESPGLGARITEVKPKQKNPWFLDQFKGREARGLNLNNIQAISGATITTKAVIDAIKETMKEILEKIR